MSNSVTYTIRSGSILYIYIAQQVQHVMEENGIYGIYQSAYRAHHSAETALVRIHNDIAHSIDNRQSVLLVLLDLSAAFDTIDHTILLRRLSGYGLSGDVLAWLTSYLCDRTYVVRVKSGVSESDIITTGVPQGTAIVQRVHRTTDDTFTKAQYSPPPIRRRHPTVHHFPTNRPHTSPRAYGSLRTRRESMAL